MRTITTQEQKAVSGGRHSVGNGNLTLGHLTVSWGSYGNGGSYFKWNNLTESGSAYSNGTSGGGTHTSVFGKVTTWSWW